MMTLHVINGLLLLLVSAVFAACETTMPHVLEKTAQGDELRNETVMGVPLPSGCPVVTVSKERGKDGLTVSYREPTADQSGAPLKELAYTTIYMSPPKGQAQAIRVWTNDPRGGALVTIRNVVPPAETFHFCVTATNWARMESTLGGQ
jgi:hypothetical protein